jgi:ribonucleotide reductase beta subunit family protein with ferritin-like domain
MDIPTTTYMISLGLVFLFFIVGLSIICYQNYQKKKKIDLLERNKFIGQIYQDFIDNPNDENFFRGLI